MDEYDDHDYCGQCDRHTVKCWCFIHVKPADDDDLCTTPDSHPKQ